MSDSRSSLPGKDRQPRIDQLDLSSSDAGSTQQTLNELQAENGVLRAHIELLLKERKLHKEYKTKIEAFLVQIHEQCKAERAQFAQELQALQADLAQVTKKYSDLKLKRRPSFLKEPPVQTPPKSPAKPPPPTELFVLSKTIVGLEIERAGLRHGLRSPSKSHPYKLQQQLATTEQKLVQAKSLQESLVQSTIASRYK